MLRREGLRRETRWQKEANDKQPEKLQICKARSIIVFPCYWLSNDNASTCCYDNFKSDNWSDIPTTEWWSISDCNDERVFSCASCAPWSDCTVAQWTLLNLSRCSTAFQMAPGRENKARLYRVLMSQRMHTSERTAVAEGSCVYIGRKCYAYRDGDSIRPGGHGGSGLVPSLRPLSGIISAQLCASQTAEEPPNRGGTKELLCCKIWVLKLEVPK